MIATRKNIIYSLLLLVLAYTSFLMLRIMFIYIPVNTEAGFLQLKQDYINIPVWRFAFFTHVFTSILVLLAGFTQFSGYIMKHNPTLHRFFGYVYVIDILLVTGPASLLMSFYANGGTSSRIAFVLLAVLWMGSTAVALYHAKRKNFTAHRIYMIRSFAFTLSAITLRTWKVLLAEFTNIHPMDRYRMIAWLGWTVNILVAEIIIRKYFSNKLLHSRQVVQ
ncbi:MAG: DUF2306 domain-containing protein [Bacteroidetes bacterium]|nr:DUF2306 domain-containing protein [Bacteroidota bacterium]